jgi:hypothetical protein
MNTPKPCDTCANLYYDAMAKDDPNYSSDCKLNLKCGNLACSKYALWNGKYSAVTRQLTGTPHINHAYIYSKITGKVVKACSHNHRHQHMAQKCANKMLAKLIEEEQKTT